MYVSFDPYAGATYIELSDQKPARTISVTDLVMVDVDERGRMVGVEFAVRPDEISDEMLGALVAHFPDAKQFSERDRWILAPA